MKWLWLLLISGTLLAQTHEILRPTAEADAGANTSIGCTGTNVGSLSWPNAWDAAGLPTSSNHSQSGIGNSFTNSFNTRIFKPWASTTNSYSALTLNVNSSSAGFGSASTNGAGNAAISYSLNNGSTWVNIRNDTSGLGWVQTTDTIVLATSQNLAQLQVGICLQGNGGKGMFSNIGTDSMTVFDIWTDGTFSVATPTPVNIPINPSVPQPVIMSRKVSWVLPLGLCCVLWWMNFLGKRPQLKHK